MSIRPTSRLTRSAAVPLAQVAVPLVALLAAACIPPWATSEPDPRPDEEETPAARAPSDYAHQVEYHVTCSTRTECRIRYLDSAGRTRDIDAVGEWRLTLGADPGARLWVQVASGGCPASTVSATIAVDGLERAEAVDSPDPELRCDWLTAEAEVSVR